MIKQDALELNGDWQLIYINGPHISFNELYRLRKPHISFRSDQQSVTGNTGCNNFRGTIQVEGNKIRFSEMLVVTKKACIDAHGELLFLEKLKNTYTWEISDGKLLELMTNNITVMHFVKASFSNI